MTYFTLSKSIPRAMASEHTRLPQKNKAHTSKLTNKAERTNTMQGRLLFHTRVYKTHKSELSNKTNKNETKRRDDFQGIPIFAYPS